MALLPVLLQPAQEDRSPSFLRGARGLAATLSSLKPRLPRGLPGAEITAAFCTRRSCRLVVSWGRWGLRAGCWANGVSLRRDSPGGFAGKASRDQFCAPEEVAAEGA